SHLHSYRELPLRVAEVGLVHRHEASGALSGLFRVRAFHQDDAHVFMKKEDIKDEILTLLNLAEKVYMVFGLSYRLELSTRPPKEKTVGSDEDWELSTNGLKEALEEWGHSYKINEGDGAFYGPKIDIHIKDALGRHWQCGTIQLDMNLPERFKLEYVNDQGQHLRPVMLHRVIYGSMERFFGILIEHFAGKFPLWISPLPVVFIPVADRHINYAKKLLKKLRERNFPAVVDTSGESVSKKIRLAQMQKANYMLTIGDTEEQNETISLRTREGIMHKELKFDYFLQELEKERQERLLMSPFAMAPESPKTV
ncbi:MAG: threonine--tRNA ligase, partial [Parachlamydiales bacterium]